MFGNRSTFKSNFHLDIHSFLITSMFKYIENQELAIEGGNGREINCGFNSHLQYRFATVDYTNILECCFFFFSFLYSIWWRFFRLSLLFVTISTLLNLFFVHFYQKCMTNVYQDEQALGANTGRRCTKSPSEIYCFGKPLVTAPYHPYTRLDNFF